MQKQVTRIRIYANANLLAVASPGITDLVRRLVRLPLYRIDYRGHWQTVRSHVDASKIVTCRNRRFEVALLAIVLWPKTLCVGSNSYSLSRIRRLTSAESSARASRSTPSSTTLDSESEWTGCAATTAADTHSAATTENRLALTAPPPKVTRPARRALERSRRSVRLIEPRPPQTHHPHVSDVTSSHYRRNVLTDAITTHAGSCRAGRARQLIQVIAATASSSTLSRASVAISTARHTRVPLCVVKRLGGRRCRVWVPETRPWSLTCRDAGRC